MPRSAKRQCRSASQCDVQVSDPDVAESNGKAVEERWRVAQAKRDSAIAGDCYNPNGSSHGGHGGSFG